MNVRARLFYFLSGLFFVVSLVGISGPVASRMSEKVDSSLVESIITRHQGVIMTGTVLVCGVSLLLGLVLMSYRKQQLIKKKGRKVVDLDKMVNETQRELVSTLSEVIETRSKETGNHVKRVALISRFLAVKTGLSSSEVEILEAASPLHDVGKIGIPDSILHNPDRLTDQEVVEMQKHTTIGKDILKESGRELLAAASSIAYQHHERWDGTGYPEGLKGEEIHIFARITTLADVYDALSMDRCYRSAWTERQVVDYLKEESGGLFDPALVTVFLAHIDELKGICYGLEDL